MSSRYFKIPIHVKPYVKKYIIAKYGDNIVISMKNPISIILYGFLQKNDIPIKKNKDIIEKRFAELSETFPLLIQRTNQYRYGLNISPENNLLINHFFEQQIYTGIFHQCDAYSKVKLPIITAVEDFCRIYDIEIDKDINMEATLKAEYRHRQAKKNFKKDMPLLSTHQNNLFTNTPHTTPIP